MSLRPESKDRKKGGSVHQGTPSSIGLVKSSERITEGVPLARLIGRELIKTPDLVMITQPRTICAERFRSLRTVLSNQAADAKIIVVTSGAPGEGKSTLSFNLALAFAASSSERVLLIDGDLRRPTTQNRVRPAPQLGLAELLADRTTVDHVILRIKDTSLDVLPSGEWRDNPMGLLSSDNARRIFEGLRNEYDRIIVDTPPIVPFSDADAIGAYSDGVLIVVRARITPQLVYQQAISAVTSTRILGTILNDAPKALADSGRSHDKYYDAYYERRKDD